MANDSFDDDAKISDRLSVVKIVSLATIGYSPELLKYTKDAQRLTPKFFYLFFIFLVGFADAVFDLILSVQTMVLGTEGAGIGLGILLAIATILGRVVSALYAWWWVSKDPPTKEEAFIYFAWMEVAVFSLEDGAAILVLANSPGEMTVVETISLWLTIICGVSYFGYIIFELIRDSGSDDTTGDTLGFLLCGIPGAIATFLVCVLFITVDDAPLSGGLETATFVLYGINALVSGGFAMLVFAGVFSCLLPNITHPGGEGA